MEEDREETGLSEKEQRNTPKLGLNPEINLTTGAF